MIHLDDDVPAIIVDDVDLKRRGMVAAMRYQGVTVTPTGADVLSCAGRVYVAVYIEGRSALVYRVHKIDSEGGHTLRIMIRPPKPVRAAITKREGAAVGTTQECS